ncbi:MAG: hypothetical protein AMXMBFR34_36480 [Myxococcaceae bacterium]
MQETAKTATTAPTQSVRMGGHIPQRDARHNPLHVSGEAPRRLWRGQAAAGFFAACFGTVCTQPPNFCFSSQPAAPHQFVAVHGDVRAAVAHALPAGLGEVDGLDAGDGAP